MTNEIPSKVLAALNRIGWAEVLAKYPATALRLLNAIGDTPSAFTPKEAKARLAELEKAGVALNVLSDFLASLSEGDAFTVEHWSATPEERDQAQYARIIQLRQALAGVIPGLVMLRDELVFHGSKSKPGRPRNERAHEIASAMAEVWAMSHGSRPPYGRDARTGLPTGSFGQALAATLQYLNIQVGEVAGLAEQAAKAMTSDAINAAKSLNCAKLNEVRHGRFGFLGSDTQRLLFNGGTVPLGVFLIGPSGAIPEPDT